MKVFHLLNPSAARAAWARSEMARGNPRAPWAFVSREHPDHTETLVEWALKEKARRIVVWGGDGTLHRVVRRLWRRKATGDVELALVPAGTCNDLARRYGLDRAQWRWWEDAQPTARLASLSLAHVAWEGPDGSSGEDVFLNNAGFGRPRSSFEKKEPAWKVLWSFRPLRVTAEWSEGRLKGLYYMVLACNAPYFSGGLHFEKDPLPEDGVLRTYFVAARSKARLAMSLLSGRLGMPLADAKTTKVTTTKLTLEAAETVWPQADGEPPPPGGARRLEFKILPNRIRLWVPEVVEG